MSSKVSIQLVQGPLGPASPDAADGAGAVWAFEGIVRPLENGQTLVALDYEAYEPMTSRELRRLAERVADEFSLLSITVEHSLGQVRPGERSFRLVVCSPHRAAGCQAASQFIDEMKKIVPLWKNPVYEASAVLPKE